MEDFEKLRLGRADVVVRRDFRQALEALGLHDPGFRPPPSAAQYMGRGKVFALEIPGTPDRRAVVRFYRHGGLSGFLFGRWFAGSSRASRELAMARKALDAGVPSFRPLASVTFRRFGLFYRALLVSEEIRGARDLAALAGAARSNPGETATLRGASVAAAFAVRKMHDAGFLHADLNLKNILLSDGDEPSARILDWDLAHTRGGPLSRKARMRNLMRLDRSARKFTSLGVPIPPKERFRFLKHYLAGGGVAPPTRAELRRWALVSRIHAITWLFSQGPPLK